MMLTPLGYNLFVEAGRVLELIGIYKADKYDKITEELTNTLLHTWDEETRAAIKAMIRRLKEEKGKPDKKAIDAELEALAARLGPQFADKVSAPIFEAHVGSFTQGQKEIKAAFAAKFNLVDERAIAALQEHNIYWVREQYNTNLAETTVAIGQKVIREGLSYDEAGELFDKELSEQYQTYGTNYWRGYATNVITRSREIGKVNAYEKAGVEYLEIRAVLDHRTSKICREMHGRIIEVKKAIKMRDDLLAAESPEDVKEIAAWESEDFVRGKKTAALPSGMSLPPYHFRCRTRTVVASRYEEPASVNYGTEMTKQDKKYWQAYTKNELTNLAQTVWTKRDYRWEKEALKSYAATLELGEKEVIKISRQVLDTKKQLYGFVENGSHAWMIWSADVGRTVFVDNEMRLSAMSGETTPADVKKAAERMVKINL